MQWARKKGERVMEAVGVGDVAQKAPGEQYRESEGGRGVCGKRFNRGDSNWRKLLQYSTKGKEQPRLHVRTHARASKTFFRAVTQDLVMSLTSHYSSSYRSQNLHL